MKQVKHFNFALTMCNLLFIIFVDGVSEMEIQNGLSADEKYHLITRNLQVGYHLIGFGIKKLIFLFGQSIPIWHEVRRVRYPLRIKLTKNSLLRCT